MTKRTRRQVKIQALADEEFRSIQGWQELIRQHIDSASQFFQTLFNIEFSVDSIESWSSPDTITSLRTLFDLLRCDVPNPTSDILIAFVMNPSHPREYSNEDLLNGQSEILGRYVVVRFEQREVGNWPFFDRVLIHELCHSFGAWHCRDTMSIMRSFSDGPVPLREIDSTTLKVISQLRTLNFHKGVLSLDTVDQIVVRTAFWEDHLPGEQNSIATALLGLAKRYQAMGKLDSATMMFHFALPHCDTSAIDNKVTYALALNQTGLYRDTERITSTISLDRKSVV